MAKSSDFWPIRKLVGSAQSDMMTEMKSQQRVVGVLSNLAQAPGGVLECRASKSVWYVVSIMLLSNCMHKACALFKSSTVSYPPPSDISSIEDYFHSTLASIFGLLSH